MSRLSPDALAGGLQRFGLARDQMRSVIARGADMTVTELDALEHLEAAGPLTQRDLGDRLSLTSGAVTMLVDRLERAGWVRRTPHPSDRRYVLLELSAQAAERAPAGLVAYHAAIRALTAAVPAGDREVISAFLAAAADAAARAAADCRAAGSPPAAAGLRPRRPGAGRTRSRTGPSRTGGRD
ncbi:MAG: MarR family winged helix-turn-helix transcriptional regulator [Streptosporangiaceae bacterium]